MDDISDYGRFDVEDAQIMINSGSRDLTSFPDASRYTIDLSSAPFKLVVGVSMLSASIPRSGYVVDLGKNSMSYVTGAPPYETANVRTLTIDPGDYNLPQICDALATQMTAQSPAAPITIVPYTNPAEISNKIQFGSPEPFALVLDRDTIGGKIGFGRAVNDADIAAGYYAGTPAWRERNFIDSNVYVAVAVASNTTGEAFVGPRPYTETLEARPGTVLTQRFTVQTGGFVKSLTLAVQALAAPTTFFFDVKDAVGNIVATASVSGNVAETTVFAPLQQRIPAETISATEAASVDIRVTENCSVFVNPMNVPIDPQNAISRSGLPISKTIALCATMDVYTAGYRVVSPGIVDLTGDRFLTIRCPEVESYLVRAERLSAAAVHPGIGLLTLGQYGFSESRLDYNNYKPRTLTTPIGRLTKLTIALEASDGTAYPTRGCDHTLLLNVRYLVPKRAAQKLERGSLLSPGYNPNSWTYNVNIDAQARPLQFAKVIGP